MLRSPLALLDNYRWTTAGTVLALAVSLWLGAALLTAVMQVQAAVGTWWHEYTPVVYLEPGTGDEEVEAMADELTQWAGVTDVTVDPPEEILDRLEAHLERDEDEVTLDASMMPTGLMVLPVVWRPGQEELIARLEALEVRAEVLAIDVPNPGALAWLDGARNVAIGLALAMLAGLVAALLGLGAFLRRLQRVEGTENHLLEVFGAPANALRRPTLWRGMILGAAAGMLAAATYLPWALVLDGFAVDLVGRGAFPALRAGLWSCALAGAGLVAGAAVGWIFGRRPNGTTEQLLEWPRGEQ